MNALVKFGFAWVMLSLLAFIVGVVLMQALPSPRYAIIVLPGLFAFIGGMLAEVFSE